MRIVMFEVWLVKLRVLAAARAGGFVFPTISSMGASVLWRGLIIEALASMSARVSSTERRTEVGAAGAAGV